MIVQPPSARTTTGSWPRAATRWRLRFLAAGAILVALAALLMVVTGFPLNHGVPISPAHAPSPTPTATRVPLLSLNSHMTAISMVSPTEAWVAGYDGQGGSIRLLHFQSGSWRAAPAPQSPILPRALAMVSATDGWMGGGASNDGNNATGVMLHYAGGIWTSYPLPAGAGAINSISMVSSLDGWAVTATPDSGHAVILHYASGVWTIAKTMTDRSLLQSVSMVSANEGWVAGRGSYNPGLAGTPGALLHYHNGAWLRVTPNDPTHADVEYVSMTPSGDGWGIGSYQTSPGAPGQDYLPQAGAVWRYKGGLWRVVQHITDTSGTANVTSIFANTALGVWIGTTVSAGNQISHCTDSGCVSTSVPFPVASLAMISPDEGWAVGDGAALLHYLHATWTPVSTG